MRTVLRGIQTFRQMSSNTAKQPWADILNPNRGPVKMPKGYEKIIRKREIFQRDDGLPVYLKGGPASILLYRITFALSLAGNFYILTQVPEMIK